MLLTNAPRYHTLEDLHLSVFLHNIQCAYHQTHLPTIFDKILHFLRWMLCTLCLIIISPFRLILSVFLYTLKSPQTLSHTFLWCMLFKFCLVIVANGRFILPIFLHTIFSTKSCRIIFLWCMLTELLYVICCYRRLYIKDMNKQVSHDLSHFFHSWVKMYMNWQENTFHQKVQKWLQKTLKRA